MSRTRTNKRRTRHYKKRRIQRIQRTKRIRKMRGGWGGMSILPTKKEYHKTTNLLYGGWGEAIPL